MIEKHARKVKALARMTQHACTPAKRANSPAASRLPTTTIGYKTTEAALTSAANTIAIIKMASRLAVKMWRAEIGNGARFAWSRPSGRMRSVKQEHREESARRGKQCQQASHTQLKIVVGRFPFEDGCDEMDYQPRKRPFKR
ncbi:MAG: hypothetical protein DMG57_36750 [Acidobacteria bacterium]|nr:MAG: hypothetical protein DMG57_36750 [Acidobacteriota bacterium]